MQHHRFVLACPSYFLLFPPLPKHSLPSPFLPIWPLPFPTHFIIFFSLTALVFSLPDPSLFLLPYSLLLPPSLLLAPFLGCIACMHCTDAALSHTMPVAWSASPGVMLCKTDEVIGRQMPICGQAHESQRNRLVYWGPDPPRKGHIWRRHVPASLWSIGTFGSEGDAALAKLLSTLVSSLPSFLTSCLLPLIFPLSPILHRAAHVTVFRLLTLTEGAILRFSLHSREALRDDMLPDWCDVFLRNSVSVTTISKNITT